MKRKQPQVNPIVSGTFQVSEDQRVEDLTEVQVTNKLDEEELIYARQFMEE